VGQNKPVQCIEKQVNLTCFSYVFHYKLSRADSVISFQSFLYFYEYLVSFGHSL
jgi:hypothetical protein